MAHSFDRTKYDNHQAMITAARNAIAQNQVIIESVIGSTVNQSQTAIMQLAQHQNGLIKAVIGELV